MSWAAFTAVSTNKTAATFTDAGTGLTAGTTYYYVVSSCNASGTCKEPLVPVLRETLYDVGLPVDAVHDTVTRPIPSGTAAVEGRSRSADHSDRDRQAGSLAA